MTASQVETESSPPRIVSASADSGAELSAAFASGARRAGASVVDLGLASTDMMYFASGRLDAPGAMFTASHNPAAYNGIKLCLAGAKPVGQDTGLTLIRDEAQEALESGADDGPETGGYEQRTLLDEYAAHVRSFIDTAALLPLKVVADTANQHGVTDNSIIVAGGEDQPSRIGQILGEAYVGEVGRDERRDVRAGDRRWTRQRKGACGDAGQLGYVDGIRRGDADSQK